MNSSEMIDRTNFNHKNRQNSGDGPVSRNTVSFRTAAFALLALGLAGCAAVPVRDYPKRILGKWEIRTYGHVFKPDGTVVVFNPDNGDFVEKGTWSLAGNRLSMNWEERETPLRQSVRIKFLGPDAWEWYSTKGRVWGATRMDANAPAP